MAAAIVLRVQQILRNWTQVPSLLISLLRPSVYRVYALFRPIDEPAKAATAPTDELDTTSNTLTLPDWRKLGYAQYGLQTGSRTVFYLHGLPGSRIEAAAFDAMAAKLGARIVAVDRPGMGLSSPQPGRTILDHARDIEYLAESFELDRYGVLV